MNELDNNEQFGFVQFHPSYDYTDFVEGLRPVFEDNQVGFELKKGIFYEFCEKVKKSSVVGNIDNFDEVWDKLILKLEEENFLTIKTLTKRSQFNIELTKNGEGLVTRTYPGEYYKGEWIQGKSNFYNKEQCYRIYQGKKGVPQGGLDNYRKAIVQYMKDELGLLEFVKGTEENSDKKYIFVIDEINRGEISKIFGELFFSIDPDYRGKKGSIQTQYFNLHEDMEEKFYIPENVYIIGTMNDIDRSVDTFDFAMRRRFLFEEITAEDSQIMLKNEKTKDLMTKLNSAIIEIGKLTKDYQIGGSYFKSLDEDKISKEELWNNKLSPLLQDYFRGEHDSVNKLEEIKKIYFEVEND